MNQVAVGDSLTQIQIDSLESTRILTEQSLTDSSATRFDLGEREYSVGSAGSTGDKDRSVRGAEIRIKFGLSSVRS